MYSKLKTIERSFEDISHELFNRQNTSDTNNIPVAPRKGSQIKRGFYLYLESCKMNALAVIIFIILSITIGILTVCLTAPKSNTTCQRTFRRTMKSSLISSSHPRSVAVGDFNHDHYMDFVVVKSGTNIIGIFISQDDGTFTEQQTYSTGSGSYPYSIAINDFNNDTHLDIVVANYDTNSIGVFLGIGDGNFTNQTIVSLGSSRPLFVTIADLNNDHRLDIIVANNGTNNIGIIFGYGNGSFQDQMTYYTGYDSIPSSLAVGDLNKDGQPDIVVANYGTNNIGIFFNYGNGSFADQITYTTFPESNPSSIALGDFNNDNRLDIVVANSGTGNVGILVGHNNGSFLTQIKYSIGINAHPQYIAVGDLNKDNELDVVISDTENDQIHVLQGYGNGSFASITTYDGISDSSPMCIVITDFNNNNQSDIVIVNYGTNNVLLLTDYSFKSSVRQKNYHVGTPSMTSEIALGDFNNDHFLDIVSHTDKGLILLFGLGDGTFRDLLTLLIRNGTNIYHIYVGDINNDNRMDIVTCDIDADVVDIFVGYGNGTFATITTYSTGIGSDPSFVTVSDVNNDNVLDIITANEGTSTIGIFLGQRDDIFTDMMTYSTGIDSLPNSLAVGNINNDTYLDIIVTSWNDKVIVFFGQGNGSFTIQHTYSTIKDSAPTSIVLADFNDDNYLDIVIANDYGFYISVFLGIGNGTFAVQTTYSTGAVSYPYYVIVADFNNDNISDIATANNNIDEVVIFHGYGNGSFELARTYSTGFGSKPYGIAAVDLDNNTQLEFVVALWGTGDIAVLTKYDAAEFANQTTSSTGSALQPYSVAVGDFNNDNRSDIVVANSGTNNLHILRGLNNDTFDINTIYPIGINYRPRYVITCDINKDNQLDIVSINSKNNSISLIIGHANESFAEQLTYSTGDYSNPYAAVSGYFNNDTYLDLLIANEGTNSIGIFYGFNYTSFHSPRTYSSMNIQEPFGIVVSNLNNDNYLDIAVTYHWNSSIGILLGYDNGSFASMMTYSTGDGSRPWGIAVGDFNNDSQSDIVVANTVTNTVGVLLGYGNGSFAAVTTYSTGYGSLPTAVATGDFNNDGRLDIVVANRGTDNVGVLFGYTNESFSYVQTYSTGTGSVPRSVIVADFNNDGLLDIAVANYETDKVGILLGYANGTFEDQISFSTGSYSRPIWIIVGDFNNDNQLDIATANYNTNNVGILLGYGNGTFATVKMYSTGSGSSPCHIDVNDFNNDNVSDIAVANYGTNNIVILFGIGDGSFLLGKPHSTGTGSPPSAVAIGDFNKDSRTDIAIANFETGVGVLLGYNNEPLATMTVYTTGDGSQPHSITVGDLNNDGSSDIVVANYGTNNVGILLGHGDGFFDPMITYSTGNGSAPYSVAIADFNRDHHLDIVVTNSETDNIAILLGHGNGTFVTGMKYSTGTRSRPYTVVIADLNNDTTSDIVIANSGTSSIYLLYGYGNGTFGNDIFYPLGYAYSPYSIAAQDLNEDGWLDIVIACYGTNHIETLIQMC